MYSWTLLCRNLMELYGVERHILCKGLMFPAHRTGYIPPSFFWGIELRYKIKLGLMSTIQA
jgi:hypothetical protein